jgi:hypothetical protein
MDSSMIGKIEKAKRYASEAKKRVVFQQFSARLEGDNNTWTVSFADGKWSCGCHYFSTHGVCQHTMAMERVLGVMLPPSGEPVMAGVSKN